MTASIESIFLSNHSAAFCLIAAVRLVLSWNDIEKGFPAGQGFIQTFKAYGAGLFGVSAILAYYVGQWLLQQRLRDERKVVAARYEGSRVASRTTKEAWEICKKLEEHSPAG